MAFRLKIDEPVAKGFRRIGVEQIDRASRSLAAAADPAAEIHEARKCIKRTRALLRLGREGLGDDVFRAENASFRAIAAKLASARDEHVLLQTITKLAAEAPDAATEQALARLKTRMTSHKSIPDGNGSDSRAEADAALEEARRRFRKLKLEPDNFATLERGLVRNYKKAKARAEVAYAEHSDHAFHEWRKCVQVFWRHLAILSRGWPQHFQAHIEATRELSQILGNDHDLAILRERLLQIAPDAISRDDAAAIERLIGSRQEALRRAAKPRGEIIFAERPRALGRRIAALWDGAGRLRRADAQNAEHARADPQNPAEPALQRG